jgi:hypothetical protein
LLLLVGGTLFAAGLPYAVYNYGCTGWCRGTAVNPLGSETRAELEPYLNHDDTFSYANEQLALFLKTDDTFQLFAPFGAIMLCVGVAFRFLYRAEREEMLKG